MNETVKNDQVCKKVICRQEKAAEQVTRGHNIVAAGWAGAFNPHLHPTPIPTLTQAYKMLVSHFLNHTHGPTDGPTDKASYHLAQKYRLTFIACL